MKIFKNCKLLRISLASLPYILAGCGFNSSDDSASRPNNPAPVFTPVVIKSGMENGHPSGIRLAIQRTIDTDTTTTYKLISSYEGKPVGLVLVLPRKDNGGRAHFKSLGAPSNLFLQLLAREYKQRLDSAARFKDSVPFVCMNLSDMFRDEPDSSKEGNWVAAEYKLFFGDDDAELFMNINPERQWVEFAEKDEEYRAHLIRLFMKH
jgi:hypothetical protein